MNFFFFLLFMRTLLMNQFYRPGCNPKPGPFGSSLRDDSSPLGSDANRPLRGPGRGIFPSIKSCKISSVSLAVKSS